MPDGEDSAMPIQVCFQGLLCLVKIRIPCPEATACNGVDLVE